MRITFVNLHHRPEDDQPALVARDLTRRGLGAALVARGHRVTVVQEHPRAGALQESGVDWVFVPPSGATRAARWVLGGFGDRAPHVRAPADAVIPAVRASRPEVIVSFDLVFYPTLLLLGRLARELGAALVTHDHGGAPARRPGYRALARRALAEVDALSFTTRERAAAWVGSGNLDDLSRVHEVFEGSTDLGPTAPDAALTGDPVCLHAGRLDPVKDPLTTLRGFQRLRERRPGARLYLAWTAAPMIDAVRREAGAGVTLLGPQPRPRMAALYSAADLLLQASRREVCGNVVIEALACGATPVVSDIPPFRRLLGAVGATFPAGDPAGLARAAVAVRPDRAAARARFEEALAFPVLARDFERVLEAALRRRVGRS